MKNVLFISATILLIGGLVALGFFGVENAIARTPVESSLDQVVTAVSEAQPGLTQLEETKEEVPKAVSDYLGKNLSAN